MINEKTKLTLTIAPDYVDWGVWEAIREFMQNAKDADDKGFEMTVRYTVDADGSVLKITNDRASIDRRSLVLGGGTKKNDHSQRGQFGEGMKLAMASLLNLGYKVMMCSGKEIWEPKLERSDEFDGATLLTIYASQQERFFNELSVEVYDVTDKDWEEIQNRLLFINDPDPDKVIETTAGRILKHASFTGQLFVRGIYVSELPDRYYFGYDLQNVELDRDRKLADPWSLKWSIKRAIKEAVVSEKLSPGDVVEILSDEKYGESTIFADTDYSHSENNFYKHVGKWWKDERGEDAVPVTSIGESREAPNFGMKPIEVTRAVRTVVERGIEPFSVRKARAANEIRTRFVCDDLKPEYLGNLEWVCEVLNGVDKGFMLDKVSVVNFCGDVKSSYDIESKHYSVSINALEVRGELLKIMVGELARSHVRSNVSDDHVSACEEIYVKALLGCIQF